MLRKLSLTSSGDLELTNRVTQWKKLITQNRWVLSSKLCHNMPITDLYEFAMNLLGTALLIDQKIHYHINLANKLFFKLATYFFIM